MMNHYVPRLQLYAAMGTRQDERDLSSDDSESYDSELYATASDEEHELYENNGAPRREFRPQQPSFLGGQEMNTGGMGGMGNNNNMGQGMNNMNGMGGGTPHGIFGLEMNNNPMMNNQGGGEYESSPSSSNGPKERKCTMGIEVQEAVGTAVSASSKKEDSEQKTPEVEIPQSDKDEDEDDPNCPPSPWASSKTKQKIIAELSDSSSDIHLLIGKYNEDNFKEVNFKKIREKYANNKYSASNFRPNVKRLLMHLLHGTGPFDVKKATKESAPMTPPWYTSVSNVSPGYALLFLLLMDPQKSQVVNEMTDEELWESYPEFKLYAFDKFKGYNKNMKRLTNKRKNRIAKEEDEFQRDMLKLLHLKENTVRGYPFWNNHPASDLLEHDEMDGTAQQMKPVKLWKSRPEYQAFPLSVFRKHIYQERMKQIAAPFWQHKRNKAAKKRLEEAQEMMKNWEVIQSKKSMEGLVMDWSRLNLSEDKV